MKKNISLGHSPDMDDAYMFYALVTGKIESPFHWIEDVKEIELLNQKASQNQLDFTAASVNAYFQSLFEDYDILSSGSSVGNKYGPVLVTKDPSFTKDTIKTVAVPGMQTTACLLLQLYFPNVKIISYPFKDVLKAVEKKEADAAVLIHEAQITYPKLGFYKLLDFGEAWYEDEKLPIPLGINIIKKSYPQELKHQINDLLKKSIQYAFQNHQDAFNYSLRYYDGTISQAEAEKFIRLYVNEYTVDLKSEGIKAIERLFEKAEKNSLIKHKKKLSFHLIY